MIDIVSTIYGSVLVNEEDRGILDKSLLDNDIITWSHNQEEITSYLINHKDGIVEEIKSWTPDRPVSKIFISEFKEEVISEIVQLVMDGLNMNYEQVGSVIDNKLLCRLYGDDWWLHI